MLLILKHKRSETSLKRAASGERSKSNESRVSHAQGVSVRRTANSPKDWSVTKQRKKPLKNLTRNCSKVPKAHPMGTITKHLKNDRNERTKRTVTKVTSKPHSGDA